MYFLNLLYKILTSLSGISKWNTKNVKSMSGMFSGCTSLRSLPDIFYYPLNNLIKVLYRFIG